MAQQRILVIEDDKAIRQGVVDALEIEGYQTIEAADGTTGLDKAVTVDCDLILLDLVLPGPQGLDILKEVRATRPTMPVIILTARGDETDRVKGLRMGADDYVVKPFSAKELIARVEAVLRRSPERPTDLTRMQFLGGYADLARCEICFDDGQHTELSEKEIELLRYLANNIGRAISREEILSRVWRLEPTGIETRTIDMHVARLREKLRDNTGQPKILLTVRGKGYMFAHPEASS